MKTREMATTAVMAALICVFCSPSITVGPISFTLCTFAIYLAGTVLGSRRGTLAVALFLLIGMVGVPVFSGFTGGFQKLAGVTGGYMVGYLPCAWISGLAVKPGQTEFRSRWNPPVMMALGTVVLYALGTAWFMIQSGNGLAASLSLCVLPFLPGDAAKIAAVSLLAPPIRRALYKN